MIKNRLQNKIEDLRRQPEHVRLRAATLMTVSAGTVITLAWLFVLLPMQLAFTRPSENSESAGEIKQAIQKAFNGSSRSQLAGPQQSEPKEEAVSGARLELPSPSVQAPHINNDATPQVLPLISDAPEPSMNPVDITGETPSPDPAQ